VRHLRVADEVHSCVSKEVFPRTTIRQERIRFAPPGAECGFRGSGRHDSAPIHCADSGAAVAVEHDAGRVSRRPGPDPGRVRVVSRGVRGPAGRVRQRGARAVVRRARCTWTRWEPRGAAPSAIAAKVSLLVVPEIGPLWRAL